jgi:hypothetical protein
LTDNPAEYVDSYLHLAPSETEPSETESPESTTTDEGGNVSLVEPEAAGRIV